MLIIIPIFLIISCDRNLFVTSSSLPSTRYPIYALNSKSHTISKIDGESDKIISNIKLPDMASTFSIAPDGNLIVAITALGDFYDPYKREIHVISPDGKRMAPITYTKYIPDNMYVKDNKIAVIMHQTLLPGKLVPLTLVDLETQSDIAIFKLNGFAKAVMFEKNNLLVYIVNENMKAAQILQINLDDRSLTEIMTLSNEQRFGKAFFHNGKLYGLRCNNHKLSRIKLNQTLQVIDPASKRIEKILYLPGTPFNLAFVENKIYITHYNDLAPSNLYNKVSIIDATSYEIEKIIDVGKGPIDICYSKSLGKVYTANLEENSVSVIDTKLQKTIKTIPTHQILTGAIRCTE